MEIPESQNSRDARIEHLWKKLDPQNKGELDFNGLKKGLIRIDHRKQSLVPPGALSNLSPALKNANDMLKDVVRAMDKNGDEVIQYEGMLHGVSRLFCLALPSVRHTMWLTELLLQSFASSWSGRRKNYFRSFIASIETTMGK
jgi:hypothetical protein